MILYINRLTTELMHLNLPEVSCSEIAEAGQKEIDVFVSGEPKLMAYHLAQEYQVNAIFAGHYATEVFGVKALSDLLAEKFEVKTNFVDMEIPF